MSNFTPAASEKSILPKKEYDALSTLFCIEYFISIPLFFSPPKSLMGFTAMAPDASESGCQPMPFSKLFHTRYDSSPRSAGTRLSSLSGFVVSIVISSMRAYPSPMSGGYNNMEILFTCVISAGVITDRQPLNSLFHSFFFKLNLTPLFQPLLTLTVGPSCHVHLSPVESASDAFMEKSLGL